MSVITSDGTAHCVSQEVMWFNLPCSGGVGIKRLAAWVCGLTFRGGNLLPQDAPKRSP